MNIMIHFNVFISLHYLNISSLMTIKVGNENTRILLTPEESDILMPKLESLFMNYQEERDEQ